MHKPILLKQISFSSQQKSCFEFFSTTIYSRNRIAIIGHNGCGKSSLLNMLGKKLSPSSGNIIIPNDISIGYVEQIIHDFHNSSGSQRLNKRLSEALLQSPDLLLLDEPTNHLDKNNRNSLIHMLKRYQGTLIIASHDTELIRSCVDTLWHVNHNKVNIFNGLYDDYINKIKQKRISVEKKLALLKRDKHNTHFALMKEQERAKKRKAYGEKKYAHDKLTLKGKKAQGQVTCNKNNKFINDKKNNLLEQLSKLDLPEIITPKFSLTSGNLSKNHLLSIKDAFMWYSPDKMILENINLCLGGKERIAICGKNASGKSTLLKAILNKNDIFRTGYWSLPNSEHIGYLDQHYSHLYSGLSIIEHIKNLRPDWNDIDIRSHLNSFLFKKNEDVLQKARYLSGGEKARLSLCILATQTPKLLLLDEITNNIDLETKQHVMQILVSYSGAFIVISHDEEFLKSIAIDRWYTIIDGNIIKL